MLNFPTLGGHPWFGTQGDRTYMTEGGSKRVCVCVVGCVCMCHCVSNFSFKHNAYIVDYLLIYFMHGTFISGSEHIILSHICPAPPPPLWTRAAGSLDYPTPFPSALHTASHFHQIVQVYC